MTRQITRRGAALPLVVQLADQSLSQHFVGFIHHNAASFSRLSRLLSIHPSIHPSGPGSARAGAASSPIDKAAIEDSACQRGRRDGGCKNIKTRCTEILSKWWIVQTKAINHHLTIALGRRNIFTRSADRTGRLLWLNGRAVPRVHATRHPRRV